MIACTHLRIKLTLVVMVMVFFVPCALSQNTIGIPTIVNYGRQVYGAGNQNSNITQDKDGILYFANNSGVLSFDGTYWRLYPLPNRTVVRSIAIGKDNRIYVGGQGEFGYFSPSASGELVYTSLKSLVSSKDHDFADVWNVMVFENKVFFRANRRFFEYDLKTIKVHERVNWIFLGKTGTELLAYEYDLGMVTYRNGRWQPRIKHGSLPQNALPRAALEIGHDSILLPTVFSGVYLIHGDTISPFVTPAVNLIAQKNISGASMMADGNIAITTNIGGCFIINKKGQFIQQFTKQEGIQNNNILSCFLDKDKNLWFGLDNGIDLVVYSNAIKHIFPDKAERNAGYTSILHNGYLYMGLSTGVYRIKYDEHTRHDLSNIKGAFEFVENSGGQVWALSEVNGELVMGHNKGAYHIKGNKAYPINDESLGFWRFHLLQPGNSSSRIIGGNYNGISIYELKNGKLVDMNMPAKFESARFIVVNGNEVWNAHPYKGLYRISFDAQGRPSANKYTDKNKILSSNHNKLFRLGNKMVLTSDNGVYEYNNTLKDFEKSRFFTSLFPDKPIAYLKQDTKGNIWFTQGKRLGVIDMTGKQPQVVYITELDDKILSNGFDEINVIDSANVIVASEKGFFHINYAQYRDSKPPLRSLIRSAWSNGADRQQIFGGHGILTATPEVTYRNNSIFFEFSSIFYGRKEITEYSYYLKGFDQGWSTWTKRADKDYTNLPAGNYEFQVKSRVNTDIESAIVSFYFTILPPWYKTWWAYLLFGLLIFAILYFFYKRQQEKYRRLQMEELQEQKRKYAEKQQQLQYEHQLEIEKSEKEIIRLRNEKLQSEVTHKNAELASSAMNLVHKMEILSKLKEDLLQYKEGAGEKEKGNKEFQKIVKLIDSELNQQEEWEQFAVHFDSVHSNYLRNLKEYCPDLTVTELKLAAYLRLNLNTKEIAQLLNISVRGVETSRYRLRKKLSLSNDVKLSDFLMRFIDQQSS